LTIDACAALAQGLLRGCPSLTVLTTSRQPLDVEGETVLHVPPMSILDRDTGPWTGGDSNDAVDLFIHRATAAIPDFEPTAEDTTRIVKLCQLLDGIPLAIELAAGRLRAVSLEEVLERMGDRYRLLSRGSRSAPTRHQTLRACIDWTFDLCTPREKLAWARLSVFAGSFALDAAEELAIGDGIEQYDVLDLISSLLDKSILSRAGQTVPARYQMLETIRQYGAQRLDDDARDALRRRHREWYVRLAENADAEWPGPAQAQWIERLRLEHANIRSALDSFLVEDPRLGLRLVWSIENYWIARGMLSEARQWLDQLLAASPEPSVDRARALRLSAWFAIFQRDRDVAPALLDEAGLIATATSDAVAAAFTTKTWGVLAMFRGELPAAINHLETAAAAFAAAGHPTGEIHSMFETGLAHGFAGNGDQAAAWHSRCLERTAELGESWFRSWSLWAFGVEKWRQGDLATAADLEDASLRLKRSLDDQVGIACCFEALSWIAASDRDEARSATLLGAADRIWKTVGTSLQGIAPMWPYHEQGETTARQIGERAFKHAYDTGLHLRSAEAISLALRESVPAMATPEQEVEHLTKRELEIGDLVGQGLTNREIATRLVISVRTAEAHINHILTKLGLSNRTQLATWMTEHRTKRD